MSKNNLVRFFVAPCALAFGLSACSDDSGTSGHIDSGDEINIPISDKVSSSGDVASVASSSSKTSSASDNAFFNEGWRKDCLDKINEYRATENLPPYTLASEEKQNCADKQSADDLESGKAHGHFRECGEFAQNSGPNFSAASRNATAVAESYLEMMWNEKKLVESGEADLDNQEDFLKIGHYKNMHSSSYTKVACGIALSADGKKGWLNVNFY